jgi:hypothetical protein
MKIKKNILKIAFFLSFLLILSCEKDLTELNENPNAVTVDQANPNLLMATVLTNSADRYLNLGYGRAAGIMQHLQKDAWFDGFNNYDWGPDEWGSYYQSLRNNKTVHQIAVEEGNQFLEGVSLVMRAFLYGQIADLWGDAPYEEALEGKGEESIRRPTYSSQETIYMGVIEDLKTASDLLSEEKDAYSGITSTTETSDVIYSGNPTKWEKLANSLLLRYYMRISNKQDVSTDFADIVNNEPIFTSTDDDATMDYLGNNPDDSWPNNVNFGANPERTFRNHKPCSTLVGTLRERDDPRIGVWFEEVQVPTVWDDDPANHLETIDGVRHVHPDSVDQNDISTNQDYVGVPPQQTEPSAYNLNPNPGQESYNKHVSFLDDRYRQPAGELLKARIMSYSEVCFLLAEAAHKGWISGAETHYKNGIEASLKTWGVGGQYQSYINQPEVSFDGTLEQIMTQKWIANWTKAQEAWFDYRRTGLPELNTGPAAMRSVLPVRFKYGSNEMNYNTENWNAAKNNLTETNYSRGIIDSPWSKPWLLKGTEEPW